jgi:hypothetical protein
LINTPISTFLGWPLRIPRELSCEGRGDYGRVEERGVSGGERERGEGKRERGVRGGERDEWRRDRRVEERDVLRSFATPQSMQLAPHQPRRQVLLCHAE